MASKQDGIRYLKLTTEQRIRELNIEFNEKQKEFNEKIKKIRQKFYDKHDVEHGYVDVKMGSFTVHTYIGNEDNVYTPEIKKLQEERDSKWSYDERSKQQKELRTKALEIEQKILLYGMNAEIKALLEGF